MKGFDAFAGVIKSGGKTRRAAKMVILNIDHPDIVEFIDCKAKEEAKAWALGSRMGYDGSTPDSEAYSSIFFQNANNSVRVSDDFMNAVLRDADFSTRAVVRRSRDHEYHKARELLASRSAEATWQCGDPGMQYDSTINRWHTSRNSARINASNPCSEYMFIDDSACNLASLNLMKFAPERHVRRGSLSPCRGHPDHRTGDSGRQLRLSDRVHRQAIRMISARSDWATPTWARCSWPAGLPYDSDAGRDYAACVTAIMCGEAYLQSGAHRRTLSAAHRIPTETGSRTSGIDQPGGACPGWYANREPFLDVIRMHRASVNRISRGNVPREFHYEASPAVAGTKRWPRAKNPATATRRSPCSLPPAPSAS
jgi:ribonucleoside-diphosphate reductase alpha chain